MLTQYLFRGPSFAQAITNRPVVYSCLSGPLHNSLSFPLMRYEGVVSSVIRLFSVCSPSAIIRRVVAIVVDSVNGCSDRAFSHVFKKAAKGIKPPVADDDPSSTMRRVSIVPNAVAPAFHSHPRVVRWAIGLSMGFAASAPASFAFFKIIVNRDKVIAANTGDVPLGCSPFVFSSKRHNQHIINCFARSVFKVMRAAGIINLSHGMCPHVVIRRPDLVRASRGVAILA